LRRKKRKVKKQKSSNISYNILDNVNNTTYTKEQIVKLYKNTPNDIRDILFDDNLGPAIQVIGKDCGINPEQSLDVEDEVVYVLLGINKVEDFTQRIQHKINITNETAKKITIAVNENIFSQVKESLEKRIGAIPSRQSQDFPHPAESLISSIHKQTPAQKEKTVPFTTLSRPIVGAEKVGVGVPPPEHLFEKKLREIPQPTSPEFIQDDALKKGTDDIETIKASKYGDKDPYRETIE
jgi:hypothetical protein